MDEYNLTDLYLDQDKIHKKVVTIIPINHTGINEWGHFILGGSVF